MFEPHGSKEATLQRIRGLTEVLAHSFDDDNLFESILDYLVRSTRAERGCLFLLEGEELRLVSGREVDGSSIEDLPVVSQTAVRLSLTADAPILSSNVSLDPRFRNSDNAQLKKIRAILCAPLKLPQEVIGAVYLDSRVTPPTSSPRKIRSFWVQSPRCWLQSSTSPSPTGGGRLRFSLRDLW